MIIDIVVVAIVLLGCLIGFSKGALRMIASIVSLVVALILAFVFSGNIADFVYTDVVKPKLVETASTYMDEHGANEVITQVYDTISEAQKAISNIADQEAVQGALGSVGDIVDGVKDNLGNIDVDASDVGEAVEGALGAAGVDTESGAYAKLKELLGTVTKSDMLSNLASKCAVNVDLSELGKVRYLAATDSPSEEIASTLLDTFKDPLVKLITPVIFSILFLLSHLILNIILDLIVSMLYKSDTIKITTKLIGLVIGLVLAILVAFIGLLLLGFAAPATPLDEDPFDTRNSYSYDFVQDIVAGYNDAELEKIEVTSSNE